NDGGRCRHAQPEVNTNTIAVNTARSSVTAVPPPCGLGRTAGISGCTISHNPSGTSRRDSDHAGDNVPPASPVTRGAPTILYLHVRHALSQTCQVRHCQGTDDFKNAHGALTVHAAI